MPSTGSSRKIGAVEREIKAEFEVDVSKASGVGLTQEGDDSEAEELDEVDQDYVQEILQRVRSSPRQEERLAIIFDETMQDPRVVTELLKVYRRDRADFATNILRQLKAMLEASGDLDEQPSLLVGVLSPHHRQAERMSRISRLVIPTLIGRAISTMYGYRKGVLLLEFARHLGKYKEINKLLRSKLEWMNSIYVDPVEIEKILKREARNPKIPQ